MLIVRSCWLIEVANHAKDGRLQFIGGRRAALNQFAVLVVVPGFLCFLVGEPVTYFGHIFRLCLDIETICLRCSCKGFNLPLKISIASFFSFSSSSISILVIAPSVLTVHPYFRVFDIINHAKHTFFGEAVFQRA